MLDEHGLSAQEDGFVRAFAAKDLGLARVLYHPDVVYLSPTVRLYDWPARIEGVERTLEFIALTIARADDIVYRPLEQALSADAAFVRIQFDFDVEARRYRSIYVAIYRYRDGLIAQQELYYDPSARLEELPRRERRLLPR